MEGGHSHFPDTHFPDFRFPDYHFPDTAAALAPGDRYSDYSCGPAAELVLAELDRMAGSQNADSTTADSPAR
jgi:hypothetical protein